MKALREIIKGQRLCPRVVGIESGKGACFSSQLQQCNGVCAGREKPELHYLRLKLALMPYMCFGKEAEVTPFVKDRYQRIVARVKCAGVDVNAEQVNRGMAWVYRRYAKDHDLYVLEHGAKASKRGLWADSSPTPPWQWRKNSNVRQV